MASQTTDIPRLLIVDDKDNMRSLLHATFADKGYNITTAADGAVAINLLRETAFDVVITDLKMPEHDGIEVLRTAKEISSDTRVIVITAFGTMETAVEAMRLGASDFIAKPFKLPEIELKVERLLSRSNGTAEAPPAAAPSSYSIVGKSEHTQHLIRMIEKIGPSKSAVLITGPTGTGKELVAKALHMASPLKDKPFVALNCAALAPGVLESELFGHEKGAFTGAVSRRIGRFEQAHTGTLFLDEVGDIDPAVQTKLLRVLQEGEIERVGGMQPIKVDVRVIAATNRDLRKAIETGDFREDFYYRLNVFSLQVAPLHQRPDDIPALVEHILGKFAEETGKPIEGIDNAASEVFRRYPWPGNVRELENVLERAAVLCEGSVITIGDLPTDLVYARKESTAAPEAPPDEPGLPGKTQQLESEMIREALEQFRWNKTKAAEHLGLKRTTLQYKIKKYGLE